MGTRKIILYLSIIICIESVNISYAYDKQPSVIEFNSFQRANTNLIEELNISLEKVLILKPYWQKLNQYKDPFKLLNGIHNMLLTLKEQVFRLYYYQQQLEKQHLISIGFTNGYKHSNQLLLEQEQKLQKQKIALLDRIAQKIHLKAEKRNTISNKSRELYSFFAKLKTFKEKLSKYQNTNTQPSLAIITKEQRYLEEQLLIVNEAKSILSDMLLLIQTALENKNSNKI